MCIRFSKLFERILNPFKQFRFILNTRKFSCFCVYFFKNVAATSENEIVSFYEMFAIFFYFLFCLRIIHQMHAFSHKAVKDYEKITLRKRQLSCGMGVPVFAHFSFQRGRKRFDRIKLDDFLALRGGASHVAPQMHLAIC